MQIRAGCARILWVFLAAALPGAISLGQASVPPASQASEATQSLNGPANIGRTELVNYLDGIAARDSATRRASVAAITTRAEAEARQSAVRKKILSLLGGLPQPTPLNAKTLGFTQANGFRIEKVLFDSQPGFPVTALLYLPDRESVSHKFPAILVTPGHAITGKVDDYPIASTFARNGFIVLSYDPIGQGERLQYPDRAHPGATLATRPTGEHGEASLQPMLIGDAFARYVLWDGMRGIDYLLQRPDVDSRHIGAYGCSGGGAMTALIGALDQRVAATAVACYTTSFDKLLPSKGPQDGEQSIPHFIASGLGFPDWIELAAPRPYAVLATYSDMFPFVGARATVIEARRFYSLFDPASAGTSTGSEPPAIPPIPTGPALNADTTNSIPPTAHLQFITGPGGHGALGPVLGDIVSFFIRNLQPDKDPTRPILPPPMPNGAIGPKGYPAELPREAFQVTPTGQVLTSYPGSASVFSLNLERAKEVIPAHEMDLAGGRLTETIREVTGAAVIPGAFKPDAELMAAKSGKFQMPSAESGVNLRGDLSIPQTAGRHPAVLLLVPRSIESGDAISKANRAEFKRLAAAGNVVLAITPCPSPPGTDDMKSPILGPFYLLSLRADLVGRTLVGLRVDDVIHIVDYLASRPDVDASQITAFGSGHMGLVLLHAAILDSRLKHITIDHVLASYASLLKAPLPIGAAEDIVPGVLLHYDIPDLARAAGGRLTETEPLPGTADLSQTSTPVESLEPK